MLGAVVLLVGCTQSESAIQGDGTAQQSSSASATPREGPFEVVSVADGDTLRVRRDGKVVTVRVVGINTPEVAGPYTDAQCFGAQASAEAKSILEGQEVWLEPAIGQPPQDKYGRDLDFVWLDDTTDFGLQMIRGGYAREYTYDSAHQYTNRYRAAEATAQEDQRGLWSPANCPTPADG